MHNLRLKNITWKAISKILWIPRAYIHLSRVCVYFQGSCICSQDFPAKKLEVPLRWGWCARAVLGWLCLCGVLQNVFMLPGVCRGLMVQVMRWTCIWELWCWFTRALWPYVWDSRDPASALHIGCMYAERLIIFWMLWIHWSSELARGLSEILGWWPKSWHFFPIKLLGGNKEHALRCRYLERVDLKVQSLERRTIYMCDNSPDKHEVNTRHCKGT